MGGEKYLPCFNADGFVGSPPRRRGKVPHSLGQGHQVGITPAWAGKSGRSCGQTSASRDHPRAGGEKKLRIELSQPHAGSPPRRRGKAKNRCRSCPFTRITPAQAGKRRPQQRHRMALQDHPRVGGEQRKVQRPTLAAAGSPPRGRGKARHLSHGLLPCG